MLILHNICPSRKSNMAEKSKQYGRKIQNGCHFYSLCVFILKSRSFQIIFVKRIYKMFACMSEIVVASFENPKWRRNSRWPPFLYRFYQDFKNAIECVHVVKCILFIRPVLS